MNLKNMDRDVVEGGDAKRYSMKDFEIIRVIGKGYMGKVMVVKERMSGNIYAIKSIHKRTILERREIGHTRAERDILADLVTAQHHNSGWRCPFLISLHAAFQDSQNVYYLMDFHGGGDLAGLLAQLIRLPESWARLYAAQIALATYELHRRRIVYRDLKPENILISTLGNLVLTDFGLAKILPEGEQARTFCGTPEYLAPEVLLKNGYDMSVDWWSFGVLLYEMLVGMTPFWADSPPMMYARILNDHHLDFPPTLGWIPRDLLMRLLQKDPSKRIGFEEIKMHPFFYGLDWERLAALEYPAPFKPGLMSQADVNAFDPMFTNMPPIITPDETGFLKSNCDMQKVFQGFTFRP